MATTARQIDFGATGRLSVFRVAAATALTALGFLLLCWIGARLGFGPVTHMYLELFSDAPVASVPALLIGLCWSLGGGLIAGGLFAVLYNLLAPLSRR